jgi:predicted Fe-Mo cluster-binding NifX family protein
MKIAVPTIGSILDEYFSECEVFTIFTVDDFNKIVKSEILFTPEGCDCKNNKPLTMQQKGVTVMLAYKMPEHADGVCEKFGIKVYIGYKGKVYDVVESFLQHENKL